MRVSIVIIGRNEGARLDRCLESVLGMTSAGIETEVIYVDSGSTDGSASRAALFGALAVALTGRCSAARARNAGWNAANGEWILFLDGDTILHPGFLQAALAFTADSHVAAVWGHRREIRPTANIYHRVLDLDWIYAPGISEFCGGDVLMRRAALEEVGGFDDSLIAGEEPELCARLRGLGYKILHIDAPMTGHDLAITRFTQYWKRAVRAGYAYAHLAQHTRTYAKPMWQGETRRNLLRASLLGALAASLSTGAVLLHSAIPIAVLLLATLLLIGRSALRARWKSTNSLSLLCYGVHSHFQQFPILAGQLAFRRDQALSRRRNLIEYK